MIKKLCYLGCFSILFAWSCSQAPQIDVQEQLLPKPQELTQTEGSFSFSKKTTLFVDQPTYEEVASHFSSLFQKAAGFSLEQVDDAKAASICLITDDTLTPEAYRLSVKPNKIEIFAADKRGHFYAIQTLRQLLPPAINGDSPSVQLDWSVPALEITDSPRFAYRGLMLDVSRFFIPKQTVLKIIDAASMMKINKLHLHLVDDQGWRLEIKKYPKLTEVGAWRVKRDVPFPLRKAPKAPGEPTPVGGFYTQDDIREMVAYASDRQVDIIPEIEMPAHTMSSLAAYPEYACPVVKEYIPVIPGMGGKNSTVVYCAGNDRCYDFLQDILDEVMQLFPSKYIHLGGDEANKTNWAKCPKCKARMKQEGITHVEDLQGYFMKRMTEYLAEKGRIAIGWDEWTNSTIPDGAVIFGWQGLGNAGYKAALQGHNFVMTPSRVLYLDYYQGPQWFEPRGYFGNNTLKNVYDYEPIQPNWEKSAADRLMGVQVSMWCEFMESPEMVEYMVFPRIAALADIAWAQKETKDWNNFITRLDQATADWDFMGINYSRSMFNLDHVAKPVNGDLVVKISCDRPDVEIRYTLDGSKPTASSAVYQDSLVVEKTTVVKAASFLRGEVKGEVLTLNLTWNKATGKPVESNNEKDFLLTNGLDGTDKHTDFEWCGWYDQDCSFTLDLEEQTTVDRIELGHVVNYGVGVHYPAKIQVMISDDNRLFRPIGLWKFTPEEIFKDGIYRETFVLDSLKSKGRYVRFDVKSPGETPDFHHRRGQGVWLHFDEIKVY